MADIDLDDIAAVREWLRGNLVVDDDNRDEWERLSEPGMIELTIPLLSEVVTGIQDQLATTEENDPEWRRKANAAKRYAVTMLHVLREKRKAQVLEADAISKARRAGFRALYKTVDAYLSDEDADDAMLEGVLKEVHDAFVEAGATVGHGLDVLGHPT